MSISHSDDVCQAQQGWIGSEFSAYEFLYQGSDALIEFVEGINADALSDPYELASRLEEEMGIPLAMS